jgi:hypothetical protein
MGTVKLAEVAVERSERSVARLPGDLHHEAIRETDGGTASELLDGRKDCVFVLHRQVLVVEEHFDRGRNSFGLPTVNGSKHPSRLRKREVRHPRALGGKGLSRSDLLRIIARDEPDEDVRVNGAHDASLRLVGCLPSALQAFEVWARSGRGFDEHPQM